jgi:hypothetical protein
MLSVSSNTDPGSLGVMSGGPFAEPSGMLRSTGESAML